MPGRFSSSIATGAVALVMLFGSSVVPVAAQDATPVAGAVVARPAHIHSGSCEELGDVVAPLIDLVAPTGAPVGQAGAAAIAETSYSTVPLPLDAILGADHAINIHLSADEIQTYIACGEIGGIITPQGAVVIGLREMQGSGYTGVAFLIPSGDGSATDVSVFIAPVLGAAG